MRISPFTPLHFASSNPSDGTPSRQVQLFAGTDTIMVQVKVGASETWPTVSVKDAVTGNVLDEYEWQSWEMDDGYLLFVQLSGMTPGLYSVAVGGSDSDPFRITVDEAVLARTTLIQYRFRDNRQRDDVVSVIDGQPFFFDFRVPGGFKDGGWQFGVENEQFATQRQDLVELYAYDYVAKTFTMGGPLGVPVWCAELLNRLLTCTYVYFNGERYVRSESETPSASTLVDGLDSFVFAQAVRKALIRDASMEELNQTAIRRVSGDLDRVAETGSTEEVRTINNE